MKIVGLAINHVLLELEDGTIFDVNDGTTKESGKLLIQVAPKSEHNAIVVDYTHTMVSIRPYDR